MSQLAELAKSVAKAQPACAVCGFGLWLPVWRLQVSEVGLYDDARFPGRAIVSLTEHFDDFDTVPEELMCEFMADVQQVSRSLRTVTGAPRVNVAILGNQESHVHAHVIPRHPEQEARPKNSPWQDPRPHSKLPPAELQTISARLRDSLETERSHSRCVGA